MTFLTWQTAVVSGAIAIPSLVILYFLKLRRRDLEISSTLLWRKAIEDLQANAPFQRLRNNILLILQLLALCAGLFALAQPQFNATMLSGQRHIIMIDRSASMRSTDGAPVSSPEISRLQDAKTKALELVNSLAEPGFFGSEGDQAMVIAFDTQSDILQPFTNNKTELRRAIEGITPTDARTTFADAFKLAKAHLPKRLHLDDKGDGVKRQDEQYDGSVAIQLYSDGRLPDLDQVRLQNDISQRDELTYHVIGDKDSWNIGIVSMRADRDFDDASKATVFVSLQSSSTKPRTVDVQLSVEGSVVGVQRVEIAAAARSKVAIKLESATVEEDVITPETRGVIFQIQRAEGAIVTARIIPDKVAPNERGDVLATDDTGYLSLPPARRLAVAAITDGNLWLRLSLEGMRLARPAKFISTSEGQAFLGSAEAAEFDVIVLDRWIPTITDDKGASAPGLPPGRFLVFGATPPPPFGLDDLGPGKQGVALSWKRDHPVMRGVQMEDLSFTDSRAMAIARSSPVVSLAEGPSGPIIAESSDLTRRAIFVTFNPLVSNWPLKTSSLVFLAKSLDYLGRDAMDTQSLTAQPGATLTQRLPRGVGSVSLTPPDRSRPITLTQQPSGEVVYGPLRDVGIYTLAWTGPAGGLDTPVNNQVRRAVSVNLADPAESDVTPRTVLQTASRVVTAQQEGAGGGIQRLWPYLLLAALAVLLVEWWFYNRKVAI
jgi:hypothetical protein